MNRMLQKKRVLGLIGTATGLAGLLLVTAPTGASATPSTSTTGTAGAAAGSWHAYASTGFSGPNAWFYGSTGTCTYVGAGWNDSIRSARTESSLRVELWEHANCTGTSITIDSSGYGNIGPWVSAYRVTN